MKRKLLILYFDIFDRCIGFKKEGEDNNNITFRYGCTLKSIIGEGVYIWNYKHSPLGETAEYLYKYSHKVGNKST